MRYRFRPAFTLVELLVVISIIGVLLALLLPAVMSSRSSARAVQCGANLHQIGIAFQHYKEKRGKTPDLDTILHGLDEYTESQNLLYVCPELGDSANTSYGVNMCVHRLLGESAKIVMLDANEGTMEYEGLDQETWNENVAPRHHGSMNVLFYDSSVQRKTPSDIDPYDEERGPRNLTTLWKPDCGCDSPSGGCKGMGGGLFAEYRAGREVFDGPAKTRIDATLTKPFGGQYSGVRLPISTSNQVFSGRWTGQIRADATGTYTFYISHDDACSVRIDGNLIYQVTGHRWVHESNHMTCSPVELTKGKCVPIEITLVNYAGPTHLDLQWSPPGAGGRQVIPSANLFSSEN